MSGETKTEHEKYLEKLVSSPDLWEGSDTESLLVIGKRLQDELHELVGSLLEDFSQKPTRRREDRIYKNKIRLERICEDLPFLVDVLSEFREDN